MSVMRMDPEAYMNRRRLDQQMSVEEQNTLAGAYGNRFDKPINVWAYNPYQGNALGNISPTGAATNNWNLPLLILGIFAIGVVGFGLIYSMKQFRGMIKDTTDAMKTEWL